ncbi:hypothetical protein AK812_SmicGene45652, partial [Symbiodinium microadriaticum]
CRTCGEAGTDARAPITGPRYRRPSPNYRAE